MSGKPRDSHYTPPEVADLVAEAAVKGLPTPVSVVDLAAGEGALLTAVNKRADCSTIGAVDVDRRAVESMRLLFPRWTVSLGDAMSARSLSRTAVARTHESWDVAVLNPPFSCRGMHRVQTKFAGELVGSSVAMAFVLAALNMVSESGRVAAILPSGSLHSERDSAAFDVVSQVASITVVESLPRGTFKSATAATEMVVFDRAGNPSNGLIQPEMPLQRQTSIVRGWVKMHARKESRFGLPLVHTTDLSALPDGVALLDRVASERDVVGPCVLVPRVGKPDLRKVAVLRAGQRVALSDCVFSIAAESDSHAAAISAAIAHERDGFGLLFQGPCAPHVTVSRLQQFMATLAV